MQNLDKCMKNTNVHDQEKYKKLYCEYIIICEHLIKAVLKPPSMQATKTWTSECSVKVHTDIINQMVKT